MTAEARIPRLTLRAGDGRSIEAALIREWAAGEMDGPVMSSSSGPKDYLKNAAWMLLDRTSAARVALIKSTAALFFLWQRSDGEWFDVGGNPVAVRGLEAARG